MRALLPCLGRERWPIADLLDGIESFTFHIGSLNPGCIGGRNCYIRALRPGWTDKQCHD